MKNSTRLVGRPRLPGFAARLRDLVHQRGRIKEVAYLGHPDIDSGSLYAWVTARKQPSLSKIAVLARTLGVSADVLIFGEENHTA